MDFMLLSDLEVNPLLNFQTPDKPLMPKRQYRQQEHCKAKKQKLSFDPLPFINNESEDVNQAPLVMKKNLLERMTSLESHLTRKSESSKRTCPGTIENSQLANQQIPVAPKLAKSLATLPKTTQQSSIGLLLPTVHPADSLLSSGKTSSRENQSVSTMSSAPSTISLQLKRTLDVWDQLRLVLDVPSLLEKSKRVVNGPPLGMRPSK